MRSHCALYVDAGYLLASAATRLTGTSLRSGVVVEYESLVRALIEQAETISGLPMLRVNWYDASQSGVPDLSQEQIGLLPRVKVRLGRIGFTGEQKGVDLRIGLDMVAHARNSAVDVMVLVSGDDDLTEAVEEAQRHGVQVIVLAVPNEAGVPHGVSKHLQCAADGLELFEAASVDASVRRSTSADAKVAAAIATIKAKHHAATPTPTQLAHHRRATVATEELTTAIDGVAERVLDAWRRSATQEQRDEVLAGRPSIPRDVDRALLLDLSDALDESILSDGIRMQLRDRFWIRFYESAG